MLDREPPPCRQSNTARAYIFTGQPPIGAAFQSGRDEHAIALGAAILLHEDRIRARRHRRAGKDADRFTRLYRMTRSVPGLHPIDNGKAGLAGLIQVAATDGITVDSGIIERR